MSILRRPRTAEVAPEATTAALIAKDLRYAVTEAAENTTKVPVLQAARDIFDELCAKGLGGENISAAIKGYRGC